MAITTDTGKLAIMELEDVWEPGLPLIPGTLGADDEQQLLWGFPEVLFAAAATLAFILDMNTRLFVYLRTVEFPSGGNLDLTTMMTKSLAGRLGDANNRFKALVDDATP